MSATGERVAVAARALVDLRVNRLKASRKEVAADEFDHTSTNGSVRLARGIRKAPWAVALAPAPRPNASAASAAQRNGIRFIAFSP